MAEAAAGISELPGPEGLLVEVFPREGRWYLVAYAFEGRNAHQTLGMLLTRRMERLGYAPLGFVATEYVVGIWSANEPHNIAALFDHDLLGEDLEIWMAENLHAAADISQCRGNRRPGRPPPSRRRKKIAARSRSIRTWSTMCCAATSRTMCCCVPTWHDARGGLTDLARLQLLLNRAAARLSVRRLDRVSPLAVPVLLDIAAKAYVRLPMRMPCCWKPKRWSPR